MENNSLLERGVFLDMASVSTGDMNTDGLDRVLSHIDYHPLTEPGLCAERLQGMDVAITNKVMLDADCIAGSSTLKLICVAATGTNNVDLQAAEQRGIAVCNVRAYATPSVVQHVFSLILALQTRLESVHQAVRAGEWCVSPHFSLLNYPFSELAGKTLGIVGYGELGQAVARVAEAFGMEVLVARRDAGDQRDGRMPLQELLPRVDVLSLHCPLTEQTRNLIDAAELALMKPDALLINTARGGIVNEPALLAALQQGRIGGAGVDVLVDEPPRGDDPMLRYAGHNLIVTPHVAWASRESRQRLLDEIALNIEAFMAGQARNRVV